MINTKPSKHPKKMAERSTLSSSRLMLLWPMVLTGCPEPDTAVATLDIHTGGNAETLGSAGDTTATEPTSSSPTTTTTSSTTTLEATTAEATSSTSDAAGTTTDDTTTVDTSGGPEVFKVGLEVIGLVGDKATVALNGDELLVIDADGQYSFATQLPNRWEYNVEFVTPPIDHDCMIDEPMGAIASADVVLSMVCTLKPTLLLSEIGFGSSTSHSAWIELVNTGDKAVDLVEFSLRARSFDVAKDANVNMQEYTLPSRIVAPGQRLLLRGKVSSVVEGPSLIPLQVGEAIRPFFGSWGAVELLKGGQSRDYVVFGSVVDHQPAAYAPSDPSAWPGYPLGTAERPPHELSVLGKSIARDLSETDTNTAADWKIVEFSTPGGPNDTHGCTLDVDADGLPDCSEAEGASYAGVDIYGLGARQSQRDIFVELDYMDPKGGDGVTVDPGMVPYKAALDPVVAVFKNNGFSLHLDVGDLFDKGPGLDLPQYDRGGGSTVPFATGVAFGAVPDRKNFYEIKAYHMAIQRLAMFHYVLFANKGAENWYGGQAERPGNDLYISRGGHIDSLDGEKANRMLSMQALTFMHELGHNLGLSHGGYSEVANDEVADEANYKPNYYSIMNYLNLYGLPTIGMPEGDRYYFTHRESNPGCKAKGVALDIMTGSVYDGPTKIKLDYSHGVGADIILAAVDETKGLMQPGSNWVDFNCNGKVDPPYAHDLYTVMEAQPDLKPEVLHDHDDWANLDLYFVKSPNNKGFNNAEEARAGRTPREVVRAPIVNDAQPLDEPERFPISRRR